MLFVSQMFVHFAALLIILIDCVCSYFILLLFVVYFAALYVSDINFENYGY